MALKTVFARLIDLSSLLASNAFTACAAAVIALSMSEGEASEAFFSTQDLAWYALISFLAYEALAAALWGWRCYQIRKLLTEDGYKLFPRLNEKRWESIPDPVLLKRLRRAKLRKNVDMQTVCLTSSLMAAGMIAAMYLSNTGTTSVGWIASETAFAAYAVPSIALVCFLAMGIRLFVSVQPAHLLLEHPGLHPVLFPAGDSYGNDAHAAPGLGSARPGLAGQRADSGRLLPAA